MDLSKAILLADKQKPKEQHQWLRFFGLGKAPTKEERLKASQDRIKALQCLCTFANERCKIEYESLLSPWLVEQPLPPLHPLPPHLQDLIISYLPEDITSPSLLARIVKNLHRNHLERCLDLIEHCPRAWFVRALQTIPEGETNHKMITEITKQAIERATERCKVKRANGERAYELKDKFSKFLKPCDPGGKRAEFILQQIKREFKEKTD